MKKLLFMLGILILIWFLSCNKKIDKECDDCKMFIGSWQTIQGIDQEVRFEINDKKNNFYSYLHQRIFLIGTWSVSNSILKIDCEKPMIYIYPKVIFTNDLMILSNIKGSVEIYKRYKE